MTHFAYAQDDMALARRLHDSHTIFREAALTHRRFRHKDVLPLLNQLTSQPIFQVTQVGESVEKRSIHQVKAGSGPAKVLLWSQMHGDEATATMAMFDIFNFLQGKDDGFDDLRTTILNKTTLYFIPMLNPDGAERFQRRNALDIDLNRDALRTQSPEAIILKNLQQTLQPLVGFNLHDQNPRYSVGKTGKQAAITFLATAYDEDRSLNPVRERSMRLIVGMNRVLQQFIPGQIGRFDDEFEPRAFGDNIQKWGTTLILLESGGYANDPEKQYLRKLNFVAILMALQAIADQSYEKEAIEEYAAIPENGPHLFDVLIRNVQINRNGANFTVDVGINRYEENACESQRSVRPFFYRSVVEDIGDLSIFNGLEEIDATGLQLVPARIHTGSLETVNDLQKIDLEALRQEGVVVFRLSKAVKGEFPTDPVHLLTEGELPAQPLSVDQIPTFLLTDGTSIRHLCVNGFLQNSGETAVIRPNGIAE
ncbi:hypothetical protein GCM10023189_01240 [Nibrella saemangeumensis]|uniref:Peptidase M14 domain-containing protein n=1 Tax=Nibrella saemangeumensis TaxID=1084526 RepID=A0ABP8MAF8_9BACT